VKEITQTRQTFTDGWETRKAGANAACWDKQTREGGTGGTVREGTQVVEERDGMSEGKFQ